MKYRKLISVESMSCVSVLLTSYWLDVKNNLGRNQITLMDQNLFGQVSVIIILF